MEETTTSGYPRNFILQRKGKVVAQARANKKEKKKKRDTYVIRSHIFFTQRKKKKHGRYYYSHVFFTKQKKKKHDIGMIRVYNIVFLVYWQEKQA